MVNLKKGFQHAPELRQPWFQQQVQGTALHCYDDTDFVPRFLQDLRQNRLSDDNNTAWQFRDYMRGYRDHITLKLPVHRHFYMLSLEVVCNQLGSPAFDPKAIRSAGYVLRRVGSRQGIQSWYVEDGRDQGWKQADDPDDPRLDPELARRAASILAEPVHSSLAGIFCG